MNNKKLSGAKKDKKTHVDLKCVNRVTGSKTIGSVKKKKNFSNCSRFIVSSEDLEFIK